MFAWPGATGATAALATARASATASARRLARAAARPRFISHPPCEAHRLSGQTTNLNWLPGAGDRPEPGSDRRSQGDRTLASDDNIALTVTDLTDLSAKTGRASFRE